MPNTNTPVPVSSVIALRKFADDGVAKNVATPVPNPETPVDIGKLVASVKLKAGVVSELPSETLIPPKLTLEFVSEEFPIFDKVLLAPLIVLFVKVSVDEIVGIVTSLDFTPPIHLFALTSHNKEPVSAVEASFTYIPPSPTAESAFNVIILSPILTSVELIVVVVP